jgi:transposase
VWVEALPAYAPDLNPVEWAWQHLKHVELRNVTFLDPEELHMQLRLAIARLRQKVDIVRSFFARAGLSF